MKKLIVFGCVLVAGMTISSCNKNNGCPNNSERAKIRVFENDTCGTLIQLTEDNSYLQPTNISEYPFVNQEDGQLVWVKYKEASGASNCDLNQQIVTIKCLSEREF